MDQNVEKFLNAVDQIVTRPATKALDLSHQPLDLGVVELFSRCLSSFEAIRVLLQHNHPEEGLELSRGLFRDSLKLGWLARAGADRVGYVADWYFEGFEKMEKLANKIARLENEHAQDRDAIRAKMDEKRRRVQTDLKKSGVSRKPFKRKEPELAKDLQREGELIEFEFIQYIIHGRALAHVLKQRWTEDQTLEQFVQNANPQVIRDVAGFAGGCALHARDALSKIFPEHFPRDEATDSLLGEAEELRTA